MGLDLTLLPFECDQPDFAFSHSMLMCWRRHELFDTIMGSVYEQPVPASFTSFRGRDDDGESTYGLTQRTPYGEQLGWVTAETLLQFSTHEAVTDNPVNRAIWAYLRELEPETKVALYWH